FQMAVFAGAERGLWRTAAVGTVSNIAANAIAVTFWGATGAAYVMIFSETIGLLLYWRLYRNRMPNPLGRRYPLSVVGASVGLLAIWTIVHLEFDVGSGIGLAIVPRALALAALYGLLLWFIASLSRHLAGGKARRMSSRN
ncbi:MAG: polysaccharide biosynthesis C-terminal domain-containing protein, partial [Mycobacterium sp.]